jgi:hypothetical protein
MLLIACSLTYTKQKGSINGATGYPGPQRIKENLGENQPIKKPLDIASLLKRYVAARGFAR